jgi:hypothetical protein
LGLVACATAGHGGHAVPPAASHRTTHGGRFSADGVPMRVRAYTERFCLPANHPTPCYLGYTPGVTADQVAQWTDYVETFGSADDARALRAAGVPHVLGYADPFIKGATVPSDRGDPSDYIGSSAQFTYWNFLRPDTVSYETSAISGMIAALGATGVMSDDTAVSYDGYGSFSPCCGAISSLAEAENATLAFWSQLGNVDIVFNGLGYAPDDGRTDAIQQDLVAKGPANILGGVYEGCYLDSGDHTSAGRTNAQRWQSTENSQLQTEAAGKDFICLAKAQNGNVPDERLYAYASLLLTYDSEHTVYWNDTPSATNTGLFPENGFVPTQPLAGQPSSIASLANGGVYVREYAACYNQGVLVGRCAAVVNASAGATSAIPALTQTYGHALTLAGDDVFSGGSIGFDGARPSSLPPASGAILVP